MALRFLRACVLVGVLLFAGSCSHEPRRGEPGVWCSVASCCLGWFWIGLMCVPAQEPYCGCSCKQTGLPYATKEECLADHPGQTLGSK